MIIKSERAFTIICLLGLLFSLSGSQVGASEQGLTIVAKNMDGSDILSETKFSFDEINSTMSSVGTPDGLLLSFQGPTFDPSNLWDPEESVNIENLKTRVIGVSIKELIEKADISDEIVNVTFVADDGFRKKVPAENIINPPEKQGVPILAYWYADSGLLPEENGYRLYFTAPDGLYGNSDMESSLPDAYRHYFYNSADKILYPSAKGLSVARIVEIDLQIAD